LTTGKHGTFNADLAGTLKWLDEREAHRLTKTVKGADLSKLGYPGLAAKMLRNLSTNTDELTSAHLRIAELERENVRLQVLLGHIPKVGDLVNVACKDGFVVHPVVPTEIPKIFGAVEWRVCRVNQPCLSGSHTPPTR
jgi:hypothetical protein